MSRILVVEDDPVIRSAYVQVLGEEHEVTEAVDGVKALEAVNSSDFDMILLDILLPNMSGLEFLRKYRKDFGDRGAEVIVLSNVDHPETTAEAKSLGVKEYLSKSNYSMKQLSEAVNLLLKDNQTG